jgi:DNA-binding MarR family transcriptional regulator
MDFEQANRLNAAIRTIGMRHRALAATLLAPLRLHPGQEVILLQLAQRGALSHAQLAEACGCEPPTITNGVRKLESAGYLVRHASPTDRRVIMVELSEQGRALLPSLEAAWTAVAERTVSGLRSTSVVQLADVLADTAGSLAGVAGHGVDEL